MQTLESLLKKGTTILKDNGLEEAGLDAWLLLEFKTGKNRAYYFAHGDEPVSDETAAEYLTLIDRRAGHIPVQQLTHQAFFMGYEFYVNENVLIPRQDTETLVELVLNEQKDRNCSILDMCTGSGCIAISLKKLGGYRHVEGADISEKALKVAKKNAEDILGMDRDTELVSVENCADTPEQNWQNLSDSQNKYDNFANSKLSGALDISNSSETVNFRRTDMFHAFQPSEKFDVIVSNPPYIPSAVIEELEPEVRDHEPRGALDGTADGLYFYRILAEECGKHLTPGGHVYFEIGYDQGAAVKELLDIHGFKDTRVIQDLTGKDRVVCGTWQNAGV